MREINPDSALNQNRRRRHSSELEQKRSGGVKTHTVKAIIFDIGGVLFLVKDKKKRFTKNLLSSYKEFCKLVVGIKPSYEELFERSLETYFKSAVGQISKKETIDRLSKILHKSPAATQKLLLNTTRNNVIENKVLLRYVSKLKNRGYRLGILSTQWPIYSEILIPREYHSLFDSLVISCTDKVRKPDPEAYQLILKRLGVKANQTILVDDKQENLIPAEKLGMGTILFTNNVAFLRDLKRFGI